MSRCARACAIWLAGASLLVGCARQPAARSAGAPESAPASLTVDVYGGSVPAGGASVPPAVAFRVIAADGDTASGRVVGSGRTGAGPLQVPAGVVTLAVDLDPPERVGPFRLAPGVTAHVRIVDTLDVALPSRIWRIERGDEMVGRTFPPPDELPARSGP